MNAHRIMRPVVMSLALALAGVTATTLPDAAAQTVSQVASDTTLTYFSQPLPLDGQPGVTVLADDGTRVVAVVGDLATAHHVAIIVPGAGTTHAMLTQGPDALLTRARDLQTAAEADSADVAVVAFLGYEPPQGIGLETLARAPAVAGAAVLADLMNRLPDVHTTWVCHSYGGLVCGLAANQASRGPDDIVLLGSPGAGVAHAADLAPAHVWAAVAPDDPISLVGIVNDVGVGPFTTLPTDPSFGARVLSVPAGGHSSYLRPGVALTKVAAVVAGKEPA